MWVRARAGACGRTSPLKKIISCAAALAARRARDGPSSASSIPMAEVDPTDVDALFRLADEAKRTCRAEEGDDDFNDAEGDVEAFGGAYANACERVCPERATVVDLCNGDVHVCYGLHCVHAEVTADRSVVCTVTGRVVGVEHRRESDPSWTGRSTNSANPDDHAGTPVGGWAKRKDMMAASARAWTLANSFGDADRASVATGYLGEAAKGSSSRCSSKRAAQCVDVDDEKVPTGGESAGAAKPAATAVAAHGTVYEKLAAEAMTVIASLFIVDSTPVAAVDARLLNIDFVRQMALRRYIKACAEGKQRLNLSVLHDVCVHANSFVATKLRENAEAGKSRRLGAAHQGPVRSLLARLSASLWLAISQTPHMIGLRRGGDSFRPFVAGVLYSMKRGLYMDDGACLIPELPSLAAHLPALRCAQTTDAAKQLHSASHRGIASIHRSISSIQALDAEQTRSTRELLSVTARQAALLRETVAQYS